MKRDEETNDLVHVRDLNIGEHFGELALINNIKRTISVRVKTDSCKVLALGRDSFNRILGDISNYLKGNYEGKFDKEFKLGHYHGVETEGAKAANDKQNYNTGSTVASGNSGY